MAFSVSKISSNFMHETNLLYDSIHQKSDAKTNSALFPAWYFVTKYRGQILMFQVLLFHSIWFCSRAFYLHNLFIGCIAEHVLLMELNISILFTQSFIHCLLLKIISRTAQLRISPNWNASSDIRNTCLISEMK